MILYAKAVFLHADDATESEMRRGKDVQTERVNSMLHVAATGIHLALDRAAHECDRGNIEYAKADLQRSHSHGKRFGFHDFTNGLHHGSTG